MCYYGNGFTHSEVYSMPIHIRKFYYNKLSKAKEEEQKQLKKSQQQSTTSKGPNVRVRK